MKPVVSFYYLLLGILGLWFISIGPSRAQKIIVDAESYKQIYEGCGVTHSAYYQAHVWSMTDANEELFFQLLYRDINFKYAQFYITSVPCDVNGIGNQAINYMKRAKKYKPNLKVSVVLGIPIDLTFKKVVGTDTIDALNISDPLIYDKYAKFVMDVIKCMHNNNMPADIIGVANEPDYEKDWACGYQDNKKGLALLVQNVYPKVRDMISNPLENPAGAKMPILMGPSTLSPGGCSNFIDYWKTNYPGAFDQLDIVSTHQYYNGDVWGTLNGIKGKIGTKRFFMNEQHTNKGDNLGDLPIEKPHRSVLSLTTLVSAALNNGVEAWFYYGGNYPNPYHDGGLIQVPWAGTPNPYKTYYVFKQLNSLQSDSSCILPRSYEVVTNFKAICLRKKGENKITLHVANVNSSDHNTTFELKMANSSLYYIKNYKVYVTDEVKNISLDANVTLPQSQKSIQINLKGYSLTTLVMDVDTIAMGINENTIDKSIDIFPNPACDIINIPLNNKLNSYYTVEIYNSMGRIVHTTKKTKGETIITINVSDFPSGCYVARVFDDNRNCYLNKVFIKTSSLNSK